MTWITVTICVVLATFFGVPFSIALIAARRRGLLRFSGKSRILQEERPSFTAELVCAYRAIATALGWCDDHFAYSMLDSDARILVDFTIKLRQLTGLTLGKSMVQMMATRTAYLDKFIVEANPLQVVILGAGLDARAYRMRSILGSDIRFFEVDAPATQKSKMQIIRDCERIAPALFYDRDYESYVTFVSCDFSSESFVEKLEQAGFDKQNPRTVVLLEGVASYLTKEALEGTLKAIASFQSGTRFAMNIVGENAQKSSQVSKLLKNIIGEEWKNCWRTTDVPEKVFGDLGFQVLDSRTLQDIQEKDMPVLKGHSIKKTFDVYVFSLQVK